MRVAILSPEAVPFAKVGGLADVSAALTKALHATGVDSLLVLPLYDSVDRSGLKILDEELGLFWRGKTPHVRVWQSDELVAPAYFIDAPHYFSRGKIYGDNDDFERFAFFSRAAIALLRRLDKPIDVVHCNDWQTGFASVEMNRLRGHDEFFKQTKILFSIHNLAYQGLFDPRDLWWLGFGDESDLFLSNKTASALKAGAMAADALSTVSPRYAREIQTAEQGYGLDWLMRTRKDRLAGITNGVDYEVWNPETDPHLAANFSADDLSGKDKCKVDLLRRFGLPIQPERPIIAIISRLVAQKGYDLIRQAAQSILGTDAFFIALGAGAKEYEDFLQSLHDAAPHRVGIYKGFAGEPLAHQIEAGADLFLMPSLYEPCGLNQMYSLRYGTIPIVRITGGLDDSVADISEDLDGADGIKFSEYSVRALAKAIRKALVLYERPELLKHYRKNGMRADFSWDRTAQEYVEAYERALGY